MRQGIFCNGATYSLEPRKIDEWWNGSSWMTEFVGHINVHSILLGYKLTLGHKLSGVRNKGVNCNRKID